MPHYRRVLEHHRGFADERYTGIGHNPVSAPAEVDDSNSTQPRGLWAAVVDFLASPAGGDWVLFKRDNRSAGMTILRRESTLHHRQPSKVKARA